MPVAMPFAVSRARLPVRRRGGWLSRWRSATSTLEPIHADRTPRQTTDDRFDGGALTSDAGLLALREVERRLDVSGRLAAAIDEPRDPTRTVHSVADILRFRMLLITAGYENGIDANALRGDPVFKLALERLPGARDLSSQSTISRLENLPDPRRSSRMGRSPHRPDGRLRFANRLDRLLPVDGRAVLRVFRPSAEAAHAGYPKNREGDTFNALHGGQQLQLFNAHNDA